MRQTPSFIERIALLVPWMFPVWLIVKGSNGEIDGLLVFVLIVISLPLIFIINVITLVALRGRTIMKQFKQATRGPDKTPLKSTNYSDLPWWDIRKWKK